MPRYYNKRKETRTLTDLVLMMLCQKSESVLDSRCTTVYEAGEGWKGTRETGGIRRWVSQWVESYGARETLLVTARVAFPKSIFPEG
jgi:hypothetical protein